MTGSFLNEFPASRESCLLGQTAVHKRIEGVFPVREPRPGVHCWGSNNYYQLGSDLETASMVPAPPVGLH